MNKETKRISENNSTTASSAVDENNQQQKKAVTNNEDRMLERWTYTANGYTFTVKPVMLGEEPEFLNDLKASPVPTQLIEEGVMPTDKELGRWAITLFSEPLNDHMQNENKKEKSFLEKVKIFFFTKVFKKKNFHYYEDFPAVQPILKWVERKVTYQNKPILFYDLERKFQLNKAEIEKLFIFLYQISGF